MRKNDHKADTEKHYKEAEKNEKSDKMEIEKYKPESEKNYKSKDKFIRSGSVKRKHSGTLDDISPFTVQDQDFKVRKKVQAMNFVKNIVPAPIH